MKIIRDENRIHRLKKVSQYFSLIGMAALIGGLFLVFSGNQNAILYQLIALGVGWILSQVGVYYANRYARDPRSDEVLDDVLKHLFKEGRLYHYFFRAPHVLLTRNGIIVFHTKYQSGKIIANGERWRQTGVGMRQFFGQEGIGNPFKEVEAQVGIIANYIRKNAPEVEEVPIAPIIVFTTKNIQSLDVEHSDVPAMHYTKVKGYLRQNKDTLPALPKGVYDALQRAFDKKAASVIE